MGPDSGDLAATDIGAADAAAVIDYLRRHPDFLADNPDILDALTPPRRHGEAVVDMQAYLLDRARRQLSDAVARERQLVATVESNVEGQARIHRAVLALATADGLGALLRSVRDDLPAILKIVMAAICLEPKDGDTPHADWIAATLAPGSLASLVGRNRRIVLKPGNDGLEPVFGPAAGTIKSVALMRLRPRANGPQALFALGSARADGFHPAQGTDLLAFLADAAEICLGKCLPPKS